MITAQIIWLLNAILHPIFGLQNWSVPGVYKNLVSAGRVYLFLDNRQRKKIHREISVGNVLLASYGYLVNLSRQIHDAFPTCVLGLASFTIWVAASKFVEQVQTDFNERKKITISQLHDKFNELAKLADVINAAWSVLIFWVLLDATAWHATGLDMLITYKNYILKLSAIYNMGFIILSLILSAESARKVNHVKVKAEIFLDS